MEVQYVYAPSPAILMAGLGCCLCLVLYLWYLWVLMSLHHVLGWVTTNVVVSASAKWDGSQFNKIGIYLVHYLLSTVWVAGGVGVLCPGVALLFSKLR